MPDIDPNLASVTEERWYHKLAFVRRLSYLWLRFVKLRMTPDQIARGMAIGMFFGFAPVLGLQIAAAVFFAALFKGSKIAAAIGTWVSNPLTYAPMWWFEWKVGVWMLGYSSERPTEMAPVWELLEEKLWEIGAPILLGWFICGSLAALLTYLIGRRVILYIQFQRLQRVGESSLGDDESDDHLDLFP